MRVHIIGGGVAGLAAAIGCVERGVAVTLYEAAPQLGGRCRSYRHDEFGCDLDNGAHAVLANNAAVHRYLKTIGATDRLATFGRDGLPFVDVRDRATWNLRLPQGLWAKSARPPGTSAWDLICSARLLWGSANKAAHTSLNASITAVEKLWEPLCTSALNTPLIEADAALLSTVVRGMMRWSGLRSGLKLPMHSLTHTYIAPAQEWLQRHGAIVHLQLPLRDVGKSNTRVERLVFSQTEVTVQATDAVVFALPPWAPVWRQLGLNFDALALSPIVNVHFRIAPTHASRFVGMIGGLSQWLWVHDGVATVTISAADAHMNTDGDTLAKTIWTEIAPLLGDPQMPLPPVHVVKERRATIRHVPGVAAYRPAIKTIFQNVFLAGDWVNTGLPCTLESAVQAGFNAGLACLMPGLR